MDVKSLESVTTALEQVAATLRGTATPAKKRMPLEDFVTHTLAEISKASKDEPPKARRRLTALKRAVDSVLVQLSKIAAEDTESNGITVEVETAFAPSRSEGDTPMADLTTSEDQSESEVALTSVGSANAGTAFAENLTKIGKALAEMKAELAGTSGAKRRAAAKRGNPERDTKASQGVDPARESGNASFKARMTARRS